ncbi:MAG: T9SS type A sorting domain-containing protein, partial [Bacteroidetes bacterium]|nr:T9SS type A sorting domain-containing protein [Bacteroidota bacterium]
ELVNGKLTAGEKSVSFNAAGLSSGVYIYRIQAGNQTVTRSMLLTK